MTGSVGTRDYVVLLLGNGPEDALFLQGKVLVEYAQVCGETLAKAHARTGDAAALAGYCGKTDNLDRALADFALAYAAQTTQDHAALVAAVQGHQLAADAVM